MGHLARCLLVTCCEVTPVDAHRVTAVGIAVVAELPVCGEAVCCLWSRWISTTSPCSMMLAYGVLYDVASLRENVAPTAGDGFGPRLQMGSGTVTARGSAAAA